jgi:quinol monooxygenase YgiN
MVADRIGQVSAALGLSLLLVATVGCSDDENNGDSNGAPGSTSGTGATGGGGVGGDSGGSGAAGATGGGGGAGGGASLEYAAMIRGTLADGNLEQAKAAHDAIAEGGQRAAMAAGDIAHDVLLGTTLLDSTENEFFAFDRWTDAEAMQAFYADPEVAAAFGSLFAAPPTVEYLAFHPEWVSWGDMESGDASDVYWFHLADGVLADKDPESAQAAHDQVAAGGKDPSIQAGNVAHLVFLGLDDPSRFVAVDIWGSAANIEAFYTNPDFVKAFAPLFESVAEPVYQSTDWYQW